jgi:four helix bundle protein
MPFLFEKLDVYNKAMQFADEITSLTESFPPAKYFLRDQLNRAALSVSNNIAEGNGRYTKNDKIHFFHIARGSAFECVSTLELCKRKGIISNEKNEEHKKTLDDICKMISGLIKNQERLDGEK